MCAAVCANAQSVAPNTSKKYLKVGVNYLKLDAPDATGPHYNIEYLSYIVDNKILLSTALGYFESNNRINVINDIYTSGNFRRRITGDITISFVPIKTIRHSINIGVGPSFWHRTDKIYRSINYTLKPDGSVTDLVVDSRNTKKVDIGIHGVVAYQYAISKHLNITSQVSLARFRSTSIIPIAGIGVGFRL